MYDLQFHGLFTMKKIYDGDGRKNPEKQKVTKSRKKFPVGCPPLPRLRKVEAGCFPAWENTENKPDLP